MDRSELIKQAIEVCGGTQKALADAIGLTQPGVHWLLYGDGQVSAETAIKIDMATKGRVRKEALRPDIFKGAA